MSEYIDKSEAVGEGYLQDWYINSIVGDVEPVWTEDHIEELANDFIVIPKDTPTADVAPVVHGRWILERDPAGKPVCYHCSACDSDGSHTSIRIAYKYCPNCGAKMDGGDTDV
nr:MAG TPA: TFIIB zinc-binding [Caudoviricetes sp.]